MGEAASVPLVAVGVDGTDEAVEAARYAAAVASARGWDLMVVHADALVAAVVPGLDVGLRNPVQVVVTAASPVEVLRLVSGFVSLLVLGHHHPDRVSRRLLGRTATEVVGQARCPVVVVPPGWDHPDRPRGPVVVALEVASPAEPVLRYAFDEAERRGSELVALHAVPVDGQGSVFTDAFFPGRRVSLGAILARAGHDHPDVVVRSILAYGDEPASQVVRSTVAALVVVGRPGLDLALGAWSRSAVRSVLARSHCPLLVAPPDSLG